MSCLEGEFLAGWDTDLAWDACEEGITGELVCTELDLFWTGLDWTKVIGLVTNCTGLGAGVWDLVTIFRDFGRVGVLVSWTGLY